MYLNFFQKEINQSTLFKERIRETIYPSKIIIISQESNNSQEKKIKKKIYLKIFHQSEKI